MPRKLPWLEGSNSGQVSGPTAPSHPRAKRRRLVDASSDIEDADGINSRKHGSPNTRNSPPPALELPAEIPMIEGFGHDDRFRMVEDEFLDAAKQFTQHLHAAEYQRMKKAARSQNAATISSISRPVTIKMPGETKRKVESVARARKQATTIQDLLGKQGRGSGSDQDSDEKSSTWLGTSLHGLMKSPRRSTTSLSKITKTMVPTRAAAGFSRAHSQRSHHSHVSSLAPPELGIPSIEKLEAPISRADESSDDGDDDLDAPIRARKIQIFNPPLTRSARSKALFIHQESKDDETDSVHVPDRKSPSEATFTYFRQTPSDPSKVARERIAKRLEQAKLRENKQNSGKPDIIPTFL